MGFWSERNPEQKKEEPRKGLCDYSRAGGMVMQANTSF